MNVYRPTIVSHVKDSSIYLLFLVGGLVLIYFGLFAEGESRKVVKVLLGRAVAVVVGCVLLFLFFKLSRHIPRMLYRRVEFCREGFLDSRYYDGFISWGDIKEPKIVKCSDSLALEFDLENQENYEGKKEEIKEIKEKHNGKRDYTGSFDSFNEVSRKEIEEKIGEYLGSGLITEVI